MALDKYMVAQISSVDQQEIRDYDETSYTGTDFQLKHQKHD